MYCISAIFSYYIAINHLERIREVLTYYRINLIL
nr:MAG TPA: hypothetical protein [Caudoviricetes sp.]